MDLLLLDVFVVLSAVVGVASDQGEEGGRGVAAIPDAADRRRVVERVVLGVLLGLELEGRFGGEEEGEGRGGGGGGSNGGWGVLRRRWRGNSGWGWCWLL